MAEFKADWEIGTLSTTTGAELSSGSVARTGLIDVQEKVTFPFSTSGEFGTQSCTIFFYADTTYIKSTYESADTSPYTITPPSNATKMRVTTKSTPVKNYTEANLLVLKDEFVFENSAEPPVGNATLSISVDKTTSYTNEQLTYTLTLDKPVASTFNTTVTIDGVDSIVEIIANSTTATTQYTPTVASTVVASIKSVDVSGVDINTQAVSTTVEEKSSSVFYADWELGSLSTTTGEGLGSGSTARTGFITTADSVAFPIDTQTLSIYFYVDGVFLRGTNVNASESPFSIVVPDTATHMRCTTRKSPDITNFTDAQILALKTQFEFSTGETPPVVGDDFVSAQSGPWSSTSTWVGGVVPTLDKKIIVKSEHVIDLDVNVSPFSGEIEVQGELVLDNTTFTVGVKNGVTGKFYLNNGTLSGTGSVHMHRGEFKTIGDSWSYIKDSVNIGYESTSTVQGVSWHLDKLSVVSSGEFKPHYRLGDGAPTFHLNNCVFEGLSLLELGASASAIHAPISMTKCTIKDCVEVEFAGGGSATVTDCVFYKDDNAAERTRIRSTSMSVKYVNTALLDHSFNGDSAQQNFESVFILSDTKSGGSYVVSSNVNPLSSMVDSVAYGVVGTGGASNNRMSKLYTHKNCFFSDTTLGGSNGLMIMGNYGDVTGNVFTGKGAAITLYAYHSETAPEISISSNIVNNTFFMDNGSYPLNSERYYSLESSNVVIKNNISYHEEPTSRDFIAWSNYGDTFTSKVYINFDYNTMFNTPDWYNTGLYANNLSNEHSLNNLDPRFKSPRTVLDWGKTVGATTDSVIKLYFLARNGYNPSTKIHSDSVIEIDIKSITTWLREGYTPTNMTLATSGDGGGFIGALEPEEGGQPISATVSLSSNVTDVVVNNPVVFTATLSNYVLEDTVVYVNVNGVVTPLTILQGSTESSFTYTPSIVNTITAKISSTDNPNVTTSGQPIYVTVHDVPTPPPSFRCEHLHVSAIDSTHVLLDVPSNTSGKLYVTLTYTKS